MGSPVQLRLDKPSVWLDAGGTSLVALQSGERMMTTTLYDVSVASYLQTVSAVAGYLEKGAAFCASRGLDTSEIVSSRLFEDMLPFRFQIVSVAHHSLGAIEGLQRGVFAPPSQTEPLDYDGLRTLIADTLKGLRSLNPAEVNALKGRAIIFQLRDRQLPFTAEDFMLSFSLPNFYFHATTAYDILRTKGVPLGKRDFLGQLRLQR